LIKFDDPKVDKHWTIGLPGVFANICNFKENLVMILNVFFPVKFMDFKHLIPVNFHARYA
jgi:hypothetical protein